MKNENQWVTLFAFLRLMAGTMFIMLLWLLWGYPKFCDVLFSTMFPCIGVIQKSKYPQDMYLCFILTAGSRQTCSPLETPVYGAKYYTGVVVAHCQDCNDAICWCKLDRYYTFWLQILWGWRATRDLKAVMQGKVFKQEVKDDIKQKQQLNADCVRTVCPSTYLGVCLPMNVVYCFGCWKWKHSLRQLHPPRKK